MFLAVAVMIAAFAIWQPWRRGENPVVPANASAAVTTLRTETQQLIARIAAIDEKEADASREEWDLAEKLGAQAIKLEPANAEARAAYAQAALGQMIVFDFKSMAPLAEAAKRAQQAVALAPESHEARLVLARCFLFEGRTRSKAKATLQALGARQPGDRRVWRILAALTQLQGNHEEALTLYDRADAQPGGDPVACRLKATLLTGLDRFDEAEASLDRSLALRSGPAGQLLKIQFLTLVRDDLPGAAAIVQTMPGSYFLREEITEWATRFWMWKGEPARAVVLLTNWNGTSLRGQPNTNLKAITAASLARGAAQIQRGAPSVVLPQLVRGGTAGGAYPKTLVLAYADGMLSVAEPDGVGVPALLKFDLSKTGGLAECEHAYARMSKAAGIDAVTTELIGEGTKTKRTHLLVHRFDVAAKDPARRIHFHSLARLLHFDHRHAGRSLDYLDLFRTALQLAIPVAELREIARRMLFNVLAANPDDHGRNHAFRYDEERRTWSLTPAFDVTFHEGMLDRGLRVNGEVWPRIEVMAAMCREVGITKAEFTELLDGVRTAIGKWPRFARSAGVPKDLSTAAASWHKRIGESME